MAGWARLRGAFTVAACARTSSRRLRSVRSPLRPVRGDAGGETMRFLWLAAAWGLPAAGPSVTQALASSGPARHPRPVPPLLSPAASRVFCVRVSKEVEGVGDAVKTRGTAGAWQGPPLCLSQPPDCTRLGSAQCWFGSPVPTLGSASPECGRERRVTPAGSCTFSFCFVPVLLASDRDPFSGGGC